MKKVILCATALLFGTMAFAQVTGAPDSKIVGPLGGTGGHENAGQSIQNGNDNKVQVRQAGTENSVFTQQDNGTAGGGNLARVKQTGDVQAGISAFQNAAEVNQSGDDNQSTTFQQGDLNNARTDQGQTNKASALNKALIVQGTGQQAEANYAAIEQDGNRNHASTQQTYDNNDAWTTQVGDDNKSMIDQDGGPNATAGHEARVEQYGWGNESFVKQWGNGARNTASAYQEGDANQAKQYQSTNAGSGSLMGNDAKVKQGGGVLLLTPVSLDLYNRIATEVFDVRTYGAQNTGAAWNNAALQVQTGKLQEAEITQYNSGNYAEQRQSGWGHDAMIVQNARGAGGDNYAKQDQRGDINVAGLVQAGSNNKAYQYQQNRVNEVLSTQNGDGNLLNTHQFGDDNRITTAQHGDANTALIVQNGGNSYVGQQNLDGLGGGGNQIDVLQLGPNGNFGTDGVQCMFMDEVDLNMNYDVPDFTLDNVCPGC